MISSYLTFSSSKSWAKSDRAHGSRVLVEDWISSMSIEPIETDLLIVGSGFAGLWAAISAREGGVPRVAVVDKAAIAMSSQSRLCAGATIYCLPEDDPEAWLRAMVEANGFLSRQPLVAETDLPVLGDLEARTYERRRFRVPGCRCRPGRRRALA